LLGDGLTNVPQGTGDNFYKQKQLLPENLEKAAKDAGLEGLEVRLQDVSQTNFTQASNGG
jgi:S-formylglutathione hydrolase